MNAIECACSCTCCSSSLSTSDAIGACVFVVGLFCVLFFFLGKYT